MGDHDRDREPARDTERTTLIHTDSGGRRGSGVLIAVIAIIALLALLYFLFAGNINRAADDVGVNVNVDVPKVDVPDIDINMPEKIELPDVDVKTEKAPENKAD